MTIEKFLELQMVQNDIPSKTALARQTGIEYQRLNRRLEYPSTMTLSELAAISDTLNFTKDNLMDFLKVTGILWRSGFDRK